MCHEQCALIVIKLLRFFVLINKIKQLFIHAKESRRSIFGQFDI